MSAGRPGSAVILMYHRVRSPGVDASEGDYALPTALFERQLRRLAGLAPVRALRELAGRAPAGRSVVLTFDDGCDTDATVALPLLVELGLPAAFFVNPARIGEAGRLGWSQLTAIADAGMAVGSHGLDHTLLDGLSDSELERQLALSRRTLEERLGRPVESLSLPGGTGGRRAVRLAHALGYRLVLGSRPAPFRRHRADTPLPRFAVRRRHEEDWIEAVATQSPRVLLAARTRYAATRLGRAVLGTSRYHRLWERWTARRDRGGHSAEGHE